MYILTVRADFENNRKMFEFTNRKKNQFNLFFNLIMIQKK